MKTYLCSFLSRLALPWLMPLILLSPALVLADTITTFAVSGTAQNTSGRTLDSCAFLAICGFSGTFLVDTTSGMIENGGFHIILPGLPAFDSVTLSTQMGNDWKISASNSTGDGLSLAFTTAPIPGSLVGFTGGSIVGSASVDLDSNYGSIGGNIAPAPEPSTLLPLAVGLGWLVSAPFLVGGDLLGGWLGVARRFRKKSAIN